MKTLLFSLAVRSIGFGIGLLFNLSSSPMLSAAPIAGECIGEAEWQESNEVTRMRCGNRGFLGVTNYYFSESTRETIWKTPTNTGTAVRFSHNLTTYLGGMDFSCPFGAGPCTESTSNFWSINIPFAASADLLATDNGWCRNIFELPQGCACFSGSREPSCGHTNGCGNLCDIAFSQIQTSCCDGLSRNEFPIVSIVVNEQVLTDSRYLLDQTTFYDAGGGTKRVRREVNRFQPLTINEFMSGVVGEARKGPWNDGKFFYHGVSGDGDLRCLFGNLLRYRIKFPSQLGVNYTVRWDLKLIQLIPTFPRPETNVVTGLSWKGVGNGSTLYTDYFYLPETPLGERWDGEILNIRVEATQGCAAGDCPPGRESPGDGPDVLRSAGFLISLGAGTVDGLAGVLTFHTDLPTPDMATLGALRFDLNTNVVHVVTNLDGSIHVAAPTVLARLEPTNNHAYWIHCSIALADAYATNTPFISHLICQSDSAALPVSLQHIRFRRADSSIITNEFICDAASPSNQVWRLLSGNRLRGESLSKTKISDELRRESYRVFDPVSGLQLHRRDELFWVTNSSDYLLSRIVDPDGAALATTNSYDEAGRLALTINSDGSWERREYDAASRLWQVIRPFTNQPSSAPAGECRTTVYRYDSMPGSPDSAIAQPSRARSVEERIRGKLVRTVMFAFPSDAEMYRRQSHSPEPNWTDPENESDRSLLDAQHRSIFTERANGTQVFTTYDDDPAGRTTTHRLLGNNFSELQRVEERADALGRPIFRRTFDSVSGALTEEEIHSLPDKFGRPTQITYLDGSSSIAPPQGCCAVSSSVDRDGVVTTYRYDALNQLIASTRAGVTISNIYDAAGRLIARRRHAASGHPILLRGLAYDGANRIIRETNALRAVTGYDYRNDAGGGAMRTTTFADGGTRTELWHRDGTLSAVLGSATFPVRYQYAVTNEANANYLCRTEIKLDAAGRDTPEWTQALEEQGGRPFKTIYAGPELSYRQSFFNQRGQLWKERDPDGVVTLFQYNAAGAREFTALDLNGNDVIDFEGPDRITRQVDDVVQNHDTWVRRTQTFIWEINGSTQPTLIKKIEVSLDGHRSWEQTGDAIRSFAKSLPSQNGSTVTEIDPTGLTAIGLYRDGRLVALASSDSNGTAVARITFDYDLHGRRMRINDPGTGSTLFQFNDADQVVRITAPSSDIPGEGSQVTKTEYDVMGRATNQVEADGSQISRIYSTRGELLQVSGARTYPARYAYDAQGRLCYLTNWSDFASRTGPRVTSWQYDPYRGWLAAKTRQDGFGPRYEYTAAGRLRSRRWARGIVARYAYNNAGDLVAVDYEGGTTPLTTYSYDRRGLRSEMSLGPEQWKIFQDIEGRLLSEVAVSGAAAGLRITNQFDAWGRRIDFTTLSGLGKIAGSRYSYDPAGHLASVIDGPSTALYAYAAGSPLARQLTFQHNGLTGLITSREYDLLDRLTLISSRITQGDHVGWSQTYTYDNLNQCARTTLSDGSYWTYSRDRLGQIIQARHSWADDSAVAGQQFEYEFDDTGNRLAARTGGNQDGAGMRLSSIANNDLNQFTVRDVPPVAQIIGAATANARVTVNEMPAYRKGEYCQAEVPVDNSASALWQAIMCRAERNGLTRSTTGHVFVARSPERFLYDLDGNLIQDGRWTYHWDGENRLVEMRAHDTLPAGARFWLRFYYDPLGRRTRKEVRQWRNNDWVTTVHEQYLYDGWNLAAVLNATNHSVLRTFIWGTDLSGKMDDGGGVGGLLFVRDGNGQTSFVTHDGRGNVLSLVDATSGAVVAQYEYGPFGETIRASGPQARSNPIRFSNQWQDEESELCYYGHRYYDPRLGRWLSRDPIEHGGGINDYAFVGNRPVDVSDFRGLAWVVKRIAGEAFPDESASMFRWLADPVSLIIASSVTESSVSVMAGGAYQGLFRMIEDFFGRAWPLTTSASVALSCDPEGNIMGENDESLRTRDGISVAARVLVNKHGHQAEVTFGAAAIFRGKLKLRAVARNNELGELGLEADSADLQVSRTRTATFECRCANP